jgi:hypothetical protein
VSHIEYYLAWLAAGLVIIAIISGVLARQARRRVLRRLKAAEMQDALIAYSEWVSTQRRTAFFQGEPVGEGSLQHMRATAQQWFPELRACMKALGDVHDDMVSFLQAQQKLRVDDPEAWLESGHDARFTALWRRHLTAVQSLAEDLNAFGANINVDAPRRGTTFPA